MRTSTRVRKVVVTSDNSLLLIKRLKPGLPPYWVAPGGGVEEADASPEAALERELREELGAAASVEKLVFVDERESSDGMVTQLFYLCRLGQLRASARSGPEFADRSRGEYLIETVPLSAGALAALDIKPPSLKEFLLAHCGDLRSLPDLRGV